MVFELNGIKQRAASALPQGLRELDGFILYALFASLCTYIWVPIYYFLEDYKNSVTCIVLATAMWSTATLFPRSISPHLYCLANVIGIYSITSNMDDGCISSVKSIFGMFPTITCFITGDIRAASFWLGVTLILFYLINTPESCSAVVTYDVIKNAGCDVTCTLFFFVITLVYEGTRLSEEKKRSHLVASVSHELRTPLNGIVCAAELLLQRKDQEDENMQDLGTIYGCGQLMSSLIDNVLDAEMFHARKRYSASEKDVVFDVNKVNAPSWNGERGC